MRTRAIFFDGILFLLWAFLCFINLRLVSFNILLSGLGVIFGLVFGVAIALRYIRSLEKNGEFRVTRKTWAFALLAIDIALGIALYFLFRLGLEAGIQMVSFLYPYIPAFYVARIAVYSNWERRHKKHISFDGLVLTRVYTVPRD